MNKLIHEQDGDGEEEFSVTNLQPALTTEEPPGEEREESESDEEYVSIGGINMERISRLGEMARLSSGGK